MKIFMLASLMLLSLATIAQSPIGTWKTVDDQSGNARSYVDIYEQNGMLYGKITKMLGNVPSSVCDQCTGPKKNTPLVGLVIIEKMKRSGDFWSKGKILDPENGNEYSCELWIKDGNLKVKGKHWTGFSRTQTWYRLQ